MFSADRVVTIGRAPDCSLKLDDDEVSSHHATLRVVDGALVIADTNSRNGVFVNGQKSPSAEVTAFDEIFVGGCRLKVEVVGVHGDAAEPRQGDRTRVSTTPFMRPVGEGGGTAPHLPAVAPPAVGAPAPATTPFIRPVADAPAAAPPPARMPPVATRAPAPAAPPPAAPARRFVEGQAPDLDSFDEDARTASVEFAPAAPPSAPANAQAAGGVCWDFDEESATVPGRLARDLGLAAAGDPALEGGRPGEAGSVVGPAAAGHPGDGGSHATRPLPGLMDPAVMPVPAPPAARPAPAAPPAGHDHPPSPVLPFPVGAAPPPAGAAPESPADPTDQVAVVGPAPVQPSGAVGQRLPADSAAQTLEEREQPLPPRAGPFGAEDEELEEDEIEERDWVEPFSLLENVLRDHPKARAGAAGIAVLEVIRYRGRRILDVARLERGDDMEVFHSGPEKQRGEQKGGPFRLIKLHGDGRAQLFFTEATEGSVVLAGVTTPLSDLCVDDRLFHRGRRIFSVMLCEGDYAQVLVEGGGGFLTRFVRPPARPPHHFGSDLSGADAGFFAGGVVVIIAMFLSLLGYESCRGPQEIRLAEEELTFAQVSLKEAALEKPAEPKKVETPEPVNAEMPQLEKIKVAAAAPKRVRTPGPPTGGGSPGPPGPPKPAGVLSALNDIRPAADSGDNALRAAVSNIAAVRVPTGTSAGFQVTGTFSKLGGGEVRLATGGGGGGKGRETRVGAELFRGEKGQKAGLLTGGGGGGKIRGTVKSAGRPVTRGGVLDAAAVQRVISEHMGAIQSCYERQLMKDPGLQGKLTFDWDVAPGGAVSSARLFQSSMGTGGSAVAACIVAEIRRWHFPSPVGGTASVRYPFIFRMSGF
jgi:predicted component of type VI protein secretion system